MQGELLPIGQFAKMTRLSVKALRLYDEIGLLAPAWVDPDSGYRYYGLGQAVPAEAIRTLRALDMPLDEIRLALAGNPATVHDVLEDHRARLTAELERHRRMLTFTEDLLQGRTQLMPYDVSVKKVPDQHVVAVRRHTSLATISDAMDSAIATIMGQLGAAGVVPAAPPFVILHDIIDEKTAGDIEICAPIGDAAVAPTGEAYATRIPGGDFAVTTHKGPYDQVAPAYHALSTWMTGNGHEITGAPRECYLNDPTTVPPDEYLTEVQWPLP